MKHKILTAGEIPVLDSVMNQLKSVAVQLQTATALKYFNNILHLWVDLPRLGFDSLRYQIICEVFDQERGPLSLVSTTEELLDRKVAAPV
jgi:hypothetical protein